MCSYYVLYFTIQFHFYQPRDSLIKENGERVDLIEYQDIFCPKSPLVSIFLLLLTIVTHLILRCS